MTDDQQRRKAEFDRLFPLMPGRTNAERLLAVCAAAVLKPGSVRQYRMATPPSFPSDRVLKMMEAAIKTAASNA